MGENEILNITIEFQSKEELNILLELLEHEINELDEAMMLKGRVFELRNRFEIPDSKKTSVEQLMHQLWAYSYGYAFFTSIKEQIEKQVGEVGQNEEYSK